MFAFFARCDQEPWTYLALLSFFPNAQQKGSRFKGWGPGVQWLTSDRCKASAKRSRSVRKRSRVSRECRSRVASLKLRGNSTGRASRIPQAKGELHRARVLRPCRIPQAKGELHRARVLRSCRIRQAKGELHRARVLRPCRIRQAKAELHRARVLRPCRIRQVKAELHRARFFRPC